MDNWTVKPRPLLDRIVDWILPPHCPGCQKPGYGFCPACAETIHPFTGLVMGTLTVHCGGFYEGPLKKAIVAAKQGGQTYLFYALSHLLLTQLQAQQPSVDLIVPIPGVTSRAQKRGYHCPTLVAKEIHRQTQLALGQHNLRLVSQLVPQKGLARLERFANVREAFMAHDCQGLSILLVDDVATTGATLINAANALYRAGASQVEGAVLARVPN